MHILCVAEKPSISKSITSILSGGQYTRRETQSRYIKNYDFTYPQRNATFTVTAVAGHVLEHDFDQQYNRWNSCDPIALFDAPILPKVRKDAEPIKRNLITEAKKADTVMIWTDCDREGENIGAEIVKICQDAHRGIQVERARFSAIISQQIHHAAQHPAQLDWNQSDAVEARIHLDLRIGASFTRLQTVKLQNTFAQLSDVLISYGPCQFPALGFVVDQYNKVKAFRPEPFWYIYLSLPAQGTEGEEIPFTWRRGHIFDQGVVDVLYRHVMTSEHATVTRIVQKQTKKWKPLPLTTVDLQKAGSRLLKISPKDTLDIAERLYQQGFLSYPRTETDQYDPQFDFASLLDKQTTDAAWGAFATSLQDGNFQEPRRGKNNDKAHPPIHPTAYAGNLVGNDKKVYEYITRRFLASCSRDAIGHETTIEVRYGGEEFYTTGLIVLERNYLEVFPYDKWSSKELPDLRERQQFTPFACEVRQGHTTRPNLLTEADLVSEMDKNGIGTDATIAQHIQTIIDRKYVCVHNSGSTKYLVPSTLGIGLVDGYNAIEYEKSLSKPYLRRDTERDMVRICEQLKTKAQVLAENIERYREMFAKARIEFPRVVTNVGNHLQGNEISYDLNFGDDAPNGGHGGDNDGGGGGGGGGGAGGGGARGRGGRGGGRHGRGSSSAPTSRRGRGGQGNLASRRRDRDDDDEPPPPPKPPAPRRPPNFSGTSSAAGAGVTCNCGVAATESTTANGRRHWSCGNNASCQFFQFIDGVASPVTAANRPGVQSSSVNRQCQCNLQAILLVTKKGSNTGRKYWKCPKFSCAYFEFADEAEVEGLPVQNEGQASTNRARSFGDGSGGGGGGERGGGLSGSCYKCGEEGHWAANCPNGDSPRGAATSNTNQASSSRACYRCGQEGHFSNACPNGGGGAPRSKSFGTRAGGGGGGGSAMACYKCGQEGHFANECPQGGASGSKPQANADIVCYKCQEPGHYSNACPNVGGSTSAPKRSASAAGGRAKRARGRGRSTATSSRGRGRSKSRPVAAANNEEEIYFSDDGMGFAAF